MSDRIRLLPDAVANQIAAGEVVLRPSSVVKEMIENAVDAGSTSVTVNFRADGKEFIQIVDNGTGMSPIDARMAFDRHATSKISKADDIYALSTFGFRGEALASIAAVAEVELKTRQSEDELGSKVEVNGGKFVEQSMVSCPIGTQFMVSNLFYNVPARRRSLDKSTTEGRHITAEFQRVALCNPQIAFSLYNNDAIVYNLQPSSLKQRIVGVVGKSIANNLLEISASTTVVQIEGFVGRPAAAKQSNKEQYFFVNGRYFKSPYFHKAIIKAYEKLIPQSVQPAYFIYLRLDPQSIDVNVHPQKTEVHFDEGSVVWQIINAAVRESLAKLGVVPMMDFDMDSNVEIPVFRERQTYKVPDIKPNPDFNPFLQTEYPKRSGSIKADISDFMQPYAADYDDRESVIEYIEGVDAEQSSMDFGQGSLFANSFSFAGRYIATTLEGVLTVIDSVRAQESILYDRFKSMLGNGTSVSQQLLFPENVVLSIDDYTLLSAHNDDFAACGFDINYRDEHTVEISGVPADFTSTPITELLYDMLDAIREQSSSPGEIMNDRLAAIMSRMAALSYSKRYTESEINSLLASLEVCSNPNYTPSGKPVMTTFSEQEIRNRLK